MRSMRILALGGVVGPIVFASVVLLCAGLRPEYSHSMQVMSALGETGGPTALLMNAAGFIPTGLLILGFAASLSQLVPRTPLSTLGSLLVGLFGVGIVSAGVFSCDLGCMGIGTSREAYLHIVASVVAFGSGVTACGVFGFAFRTLPVWRPLYAYSLISALVSALLLFEFNSATETQSLPGLWQRLFLGSLFSWCMVVGFFAFRVSVPGRRADWSST